MAKKRTVKKAIADIIKASAQVTQPVVSAVRGPSEIEKQFILEHYVKDAMTPDQLYAKLPGVDPSEIDKCISNVIPKMKQGQTQLERQQQLAKVQNGAGQFMGRDPSRGIAIMTEAASEMSDARKVMAVPSTDSMARAQPDKIKIIDPSKRAR